MLMGDEDDHDEDEPDEEDEDEEDQGEDDDDEDHGMDQLELIEGEDDYDQEEEPDEDQEIMEIGWNAGGHRLQAANPANDIIVFNADAGNQRHHPWGGHGIVNHYGGLAGYRGRAAQANPSVDWT